jgi:hypothetical protein
MLTGDASQLPFIFRQASIVNKSPCLAGLPYMLGVEVERIDHDPLKEVEDCDPTICFNHYYVDSGVAQSEVDDWVVQLQALNNCMVTYLT